MPITNYLYNSAEKVVWRSTTLKGPRGNRFIGLYVVPNVLSISWF